MKIQPINVAQYAQNQKLSTSPSFKTKLKLTFPASNIPCNYNRGECDFERVISMFQRWLEEQYPQNATLIIRQKMGKMVDQMKVRGAGGIFIEKHPENLEFSMNGASCGFCWNEQSRENYALEDFKKTFNYVREQAGY